MRLIDTTIQQNNKTAKPTIHPAFEQSPAVEVVGGIDGGAQSPSLKTQHIYTTFGWDEGSILI